MFCVAAYLGYFGAAGGVLLLAALAATISEPLIRVNAIKNVVSGAANLMAASLFALYAPVDWAFVPPLAAGFLVGGYAGQRLARRFRPAPLRLVVALAVWRWRSSSGSAPTGWGRRGGAYARLVTATGRRDELAPELAQRRPSRSVRAASQQPSAVQTPGRPSQ